MCQLNKIKLKHRKALLPLAAFAERSIAMQSDVSTSDPRFMECLLQKNNRERHPEKLLT